MKCTVCQADSDVIDSRHVHETIRRRRRCSACQNRFTTYELYGDKALAFTIRVDLEGRVHVGRDGRVSIVMTEAEDGEAKTEEEGSG